MILPHNVSVIVCRGNLNEAVPELGPADVLLCLVAADVALEHDVAVVRRADDLPTVLGQLVEEVCDLGEPFRCLGDVLTEPSEYVRLPRSARSSSSRTVPKTWMRMYVGDDATCGSLAALLYEAVAAIGILGDDDESTVLEACLSLQCLADQVVVLVLRRHTLAALALDLRVKSACANAKSHALAGAWEQLPSVLGDQDASLSNVLATKPVSIGRS